MPKATIFNGDSLAVLKTLPDEAVQCVVTSPPYWGLRTYNVDGQIGLEETFEEFLGRLSLLFKEVKRVLKRDGTIWVNMGDSYNSAATRGTFGDQAGDERGYQPHGVKRQTISKLASKNLLGQPWRLAFALQEQGWILRSDIIWHKPSPMPESVQDRPTKAHEYLFLLAKSERYYYDIDAIREKFVSDWVETPGSAAGADHKNLESKGQRPHTMHLKRVRGVPTDPEQYETLKATMREVHHGEEYKASTPLVEGAGVWKRNLEGGITHPAGRNKRSVWTIPPEPFPEAHFATFPTALVEPCILAGSKPGDLVLDPFSGSGTTGLVAARLQRDYWGIELNPDYVEMSRKRIAEDQPLFTTVEVNVA